MPKGVVKSKSDERAWRRAKDAASKSYASGSAEFWPAVMSIFKNMTGRESLDGRDLVRLVESGIDEQELISAMVAVSSAIMTIEQDGDTWCAYNTRGQAVPAFGCGDYDKVARALKLRGYKLSHDGTWRR